MSKFPNANEQTNKATGAPSKNAPLSGAFGTRSDAQPLGNNFKGASAQVLPSFSGFGIGSQPLAFGKSAAASVQPQAMQMPSMGAFSGLGKPMSFGAPLGSNASPGGFVKQAPFVVEVAPATTVDSNSDEPPLWEGPLSPFNTWNSDLQPKQLVSELDTLLEALASTQQCVDFEITNYKIIGRMYQHFDMSEFQVTVFQGQEDSGNKSVLEIRRSSGDAFVHDELQRQLVDKLTQNKAIQCEDSGSAVKMLGFGCLGDLPPLSSLSLDSGSAAPTDDLSSNTTNENVEALCTEMLSVVTDRASYRDVYRHAASTLCAQTSSKAFMDHLAKQENVILGMVKPLTDELFDTLILKNVLTVVLALLTDYTSVERYPELKRDLKALQKIWTAGKTRPIGPMEMRFAKSQQVSRLCEQCLAHI